MIREINLHGNLAEQFGGQFKLDVMSATEAVRALCVQLRGFRRTVAQGEYQVLVGGAYLDENEVCMEIGSTAPIDIVPVPVGSKNSSGWIKVVLGVALIAFGGYALGGFASSASGAAAGTAGAAGTFAGLEASAFIKLGAGMLLSGLGLLLSPTPTLSNSEKPDDMPSYVFNGALNIAEEGNCIPLCYGTFLCGSLVVSSGLSIEDYSAILSAEPIGDATYFNKSTKSGSRS